MYFEQSGNDEAYLEFQNYSGSAQVADTKYVNFRNVTIGIDVNESDEVIGVEFIAS